MSIQSDNTGRLASLLVSLELIPLASGVGLDSSHLLTFTNPEKAPVWLMPECSLSHFTPRQESGLKR